jgi:enoyl-CoA hydratase/carnithine racemase
MLKVENQGRALFVGLNRLEKRNAMSLEIMHMLGRTLSGASSIS